MGARKVIRKGDTTTHGGTVIEGIDHHPVLGKPVAGKGHMVVCPKCDGKPYPIVEGVANVTVAGRELAVEGMKTACGAVLIASQSDYTLDA